MIERAIRPEGNMSSLDGFTGAPRPKGLSPTSTRGHAQTGCGLGEGTGENSE